jgi:hypothetical protein
MSAMTVVKRKVDLMTPSTRRIRIKITEMTVHVDTACEILQLFAKSTATIHKEREEAIEFADLISRMVGEYKRRFIPTESIKRTDNCKPWHNIAKKTDLVGKLIPYCDKFDQNSEDRIIASRSLASDFGYHTITTAAKSLLGESWVTSSGRRFCIVATCNLEPDGTGARLFSGYTTGWRAEPERVQKSGMDCSSIDFSYSDEFPDDHCIIIREISRDTFTYKEWTQELIDYTKLRSVCTRPGFNSGKSIEFFQMMAGMNQLSEVISNQKIEA